MPLNKKDDMDEQILITNIQRFSLHDGPGIRTTVFCKGCGVRCPWCANPENLEPRPEDYVKDGVPGTYGRYISCEELVREVMKDELFYRQRGSGEGLDGLPGGVTYSGGEPLLQADRLEPVFRALKEAGIHQCVETSLFVPEERLDLAMRYINLFYVDIKILDEERCKAILYGDLEQYLINVGILFSAEKPIVFRIPVIGGFTDSAENRRMVIELIKQYSPMKVELIKEHNLGQSKYISLGKSPLELHTVTDEFMEQYKDAVVKTAGVPTEACKI